MNTEQTNRTYFYVYSIYRYRNTKYEPNRLPIKISSLQCKRCLSFKVRQHSQQYFNLQYKACWVLYKKGRYFFIFHNPTCSCNHPYNPYQQSLPLLQPFFMSLYHLPTCSYNHSHNSYQHSLPLHLSHPVNSGCVKGLMSKGVL